MSFRLRRCVLAAALACLAPLARGAGGEVEVLHYWTSDGETGAVAKLKATLRGQGHTWKDFTVNGGGDGLAMVMLRSRVASHNPPTAAQIKGISIQDWARSGKLAGIEDVAEADKWNELLPKTVSDTMKYKGRYVAAPLNVHRVNWLWINADVLKKVNAKAPATWDEFFVVAEAMKKAGVIPVAYVGQTWLNLGTFENVVLGVGGADLYKRAFVDLDPEAFASAQMEKSLETYKRIKRYTDANAATRDWISATVMVAKGEAGMQLMGDWAKAEIQGAGKRPGIDVLCAPAPGTAQAFTFNIDSFVMFQVSAENKPAQRDLLRAVMSKDFQETFNLAKGSIPVRLDVKMDRFDDCGKRSSQDFKQSAARGMLMPSTLQGALPSAAVTAMSDAISQFWNLDTMSAREAMTALAAIAKNQAKARDGTR